MRQPPISRCLHLVDDDRTGVAQHRFASASSLRCVMSLDLAASSSRLTDCDHRAGGIAAATVAGRRSWLRLASRALVVRVHRQASGRPACARQYGQRHVESSPPSAESPPTATTSNTPFGQMQDRDVEGAPPGRRPAYTPRRRCPETIGDRGRCRSLSRRSTFRPASCAASLRPGAARRRNRPAPVITRAEQIAALKVSSALALASPDLGGPRPATSRRRRLRIATMPGWSTKSVRRLAAVAMSASAAHEA